MLTFCHIAIQTFRPCKVLTRRDQLKLKESKIAEKEEAKKAKAATSKPAAKRKAKAKAKALAKAEEDEASEEGVNEDKDVEPMAKPKARGRKRKGNQDNDENAVEEEPEPKKPKKKAQPKAKSEQPKSRGRAKAKPLPKDPEEEDDGVVPSQPELDSDMKVDEVKHEAAPKKAPKRKAKAPKTEKLENTDAEMDEPVTPKKELFQSGGEEEESEHERIVDPKTGKTMPLAMIFEEDKVAGWKKSRAKPAKAKTSEPSAASTADGKKKGQKKQQLSPFAKKEVRRRKKVEDESMREVPQEDLKLQGIFLQHLKASQDLGYEEVKNYLIGTAPKDMKEFLLNPYWGRPACGAKSKALASGKKMPEVTYIGKFGTASCWNVNVVLCYISASLMASWLKSFSVQCISREIGPMSGHLIFYNTLKFKPVLIILISFQLHVDTLIILASVVCNLLFSCLDVWCIYLIYTSTSSGLQANISTHSFLLIWGCLDGKREHGPGGDCKVEWPYRSHKATGNLHEV